MTYRLHYGSEIHFFQLELHRWWIASGHSLADFLAKLKCLSNGSTGESNKKRIGVAVNYFAAAPSPSLVTPPTVGKVYSTRKGATSTLYYRIRQ
jgi:hypothetical protein